MSRFGVLADIRNGAAVVLLALAVIGFVAPAARAQQVAVAQLDGYVTDPSGQAVVGAQVKAIETDRDSVRSASTDVAGHYAFPGLAAGNYRLEVSSQGFKTYVQMGIVLDAGNNRSQSVVLQVGALSESIQVTANAVQVETKENSISQLVDSQRMIDLPLNGRNPADLLAASGFAVVGTGNMTLNSSDLTGSKNIQGSNGSEQISVAGSGANGVNFLLDGGDNNDAFSNVNLPIPFPDALAEFNVQTNTLPAQYGLHPGGIVNIVTKSGANAFHGDAFDFFRNGDMNARTKGTVAGTQPIRDSLKRNQFGGTIGGPVRKDKVFFFFGYEGTRQRSDPAEKTAYDPTAATLKGDFSVVDAAKSTGGCLSSFRQLKDPSGIPYPNNQIPVSTFDPAGLKLASTYFPVSANPCGNTLYGYLSNNPDDQWIGRVDYNFSAKHIFYARYFIYDYLGVSLFSDNNALTSQNPGNQDRSQTMTIGDTYTFTSNTVNAFHFTFDRRRDNRSSPSNLFSPKDLGVNMFINAPNYTQLTVSGYSGGGFAVGCGTCAPSGVAT